MSCKSCGGSTSERIVRVRPVVVAGVVGLGLVLSYTLGGSLLHDLVEGSQRSALPYWKGLLCLIVLSAGGLAPFYNTRQQVCPACNTASPGWLLEPMELMRSALMISREQTRRTFLTTAGKIGAGTAAVAAGAGAAVARNYGWLRVGNDFFAARVENISPHPREEWKGSKVVNYRRLGRTNHMVSDISLGSARINDVSVARAVIERGITYFDTSPDYADTVSERTLGEAMKGHRDKLFLATKFCRSDGHILNETPVPEIIASVEESLRRLQTDYVDLIHIHSCDRVERLLAPNIHEAFDRLKEQGKVRFLGFSSHAPNLEAVANAAIDSGRFDVMMLAYHFGMWPHFGDIIKRAHEKDMGVVAMKTLKGAKHTNLAEFRDEASSYAQAAFKWVLSNPAVACLVISIYEHGQLDEYLYASGKSLGSSDVATLQKYDRLVAGDYCQPHCGLCLDSCPSQLAVNDILRYRMYFKDYHWEKEGLRHYAKLERNASQCVDCTAPCEATCPTNVRIQANMLEAHELLRLA